MPIFAPMRSGLILHSTLAMSKSLDQDTTLHSWLGVGVMDGVFNDCGPGKSLGCEFFLSIMDAPFTPMAIVAIRGKNKMERLPHFPSFPLL
jgi:hypothetical protein